MDESLFCLEKWEDGKCRLYTFTLIPLLNLKKKKRFQIIFLLKKLCMNRYFNYNKKEGKITQNRREIKPY